MTIDSADDSKISNRTINSYESNLESDVRFEIESNHEASQVPSFHVGPMFAWYRVIVSQTAYRNGYVLWLNGAS